MEKYFKTVLSAVVLLLLLLNPVSMSAKPGLIVYNPELLKFDGKYYIRNDFKSFCETLENAGYKVYEREGNACSLTGPYHGLDDVEFVVQGNDNNEINAVSVFIVMGTTDWEEVKSAHETVVSMIREQVNTKDVTSDFSADDITDVVMRRKALEEYEAHHATNFRKRNYEGFCYGDISVRLTWLGDRYCIVVVYIPHFN